MFYDLTFRANDLSGQCVGPILERFLTAIRSLFLGVLSPYRAPDVGAGLLNRIISDARQILPLPVAKASIACRPLGERASDACDTQFPHHRAGRSFDQVFTPPATHSGIRDDISSPEVRQ